MTKHGSAGEQDERRRDLGDGEGAQTFVRSAGHARASGGQTFVRPLGGQARHESEQHCGQEREAGADPQHAGIDGEVGGADGEARGVARQDRDHGAALSTPRSRARAAEQETFGKEDAAERAVLAPSAARTTNSLSRRMVRARIRLATFEQAMTKTSSEAAISTKRTVRAFEVISSRR